MLAIAVPEIPPESLKHVRCVGAKGLVRDLEQRANQGDGLGVRQRSQVALVRIERNIRAAIGPQVGLAARAVGQRSAGDGRGSLVPWLAMGFSEAIFFVSDGLDLAYMNPLIPWYPVQWNERDDDNAMLCLDATVRPLRGLAAYGELLIDDLQYQTEWGRPSRLGWTAGIEGYASSTAITAEYTRTLDGTLLPAYKRLRDFVRDEYLPKTRSTVAWSALPDGEAWYAFYAQEHTTTTMTADEIHQLGLREVKRILGEMDNVRQTVGFKGDLDAFFTFLETDPQFYFTKGDDLVQGYRELKLRIDAALPKVFSVFPKADYEVREVEAFRAQSSAGAYYQQPSADGSRPGIFYVNTFNLKAQPKFGMETLSLHEASPGHHFQVTIQQELEGVPRFRRFGGDYTAYVEGWALYAESLGRELGLFTDPYQWYGRLNDEQLRAMRLVVDTGLHAKGWTREQAIKFMLDNSTMAESDVVSEVERYIAWPGQALGYKVGDLRIQGLRHQAEQALGPKFDLRDFHREVLSDGAVPMDVLEAKVDRWIAAHR